MNYLRNREGGFPQIATDKSEVQMNWRMLAVTGTLLWGIPFACGGNFLEQSPKDIVVGEVVSKTGDSVTLNVHPCGKKELHTISPYKQVSSDDKICADGRKYTKVTVEQIDNDTTDKGKESDKKNDKKQDKPDAKKETPDQPN